MGDVYEKVVYVVIWFGFEVDDSNYVLNIFWDIGF